MITFVTFHVDIKPENLELDTPIAPDRVSDYHVVLGIALNSISAFHPDARKVVLSDYSTNFSYLSNDVQIDRYELNVARIMYSRLWAQCQFIKNHDFRSDLIFLDSDIIINGNLEDIFENDFNIALTVRDNPQMPINGGIIYVSKHNKVAALNFFEEVDRLYREKYSHQSQWWGDQYALADAINYDLNQKIATDSPIKLEKFTFLLLDCEYYNYSPNFQSDLDILTPITARIIHFKGERKKFMDIYWNYHFGALSSDTLREIISKLQLDRIDLKEQNEELVRQKSQIKKKLFSAREKLATTVSKNQFLQEQSQVQTVLMTAEIERLKAEISQLKNNRFTDQIWEQISRLRDLFKKSI